MRLDHDFFCVNPSNDPKIKKAQDSVETASPNKSEHVNDEEMGVNC